MPSRADLSTLLEVSSASTAEGFEHGDAGAEEHGQLAAEVHQLALLTFFG